MKPSIQLRLGQHLTMTPQLQQAIRLLQLSTLDLKQEIQDALDSNMMLEAEDDSGLPEMPEIMPESPTSGPSSNDANNEREINAEAESMPAELPVDTAWDDVYDTPLPASSSLSTEDHGDYLLQQSREQSLQDYLTWQMNLTPFSDTDREIAEVIIDGINDDGYLAMSVDDIIAALAPREIEGDEVEAVLHRIQRFDPPGIAARDPQECLALQLQQLPKETPFRTEALTLVEELFDLLAAQNEQQICRKLKVSADELRHIMALIRNLNPHPGVGVAPDDTVYVEPDVFVFKHNHRWMVELNPEIAPRLRINSGYASLIRRADNSSDNQALKSHLQEARWFIKSLQSRNDTLLRVAGKIVEIQQNFFEYGEEAMKPLVLRDIAEALEMHESTISRVTTQKYMHTPRGTLEFKYFFSSHVGTANGGEASSTAIRALIKKLIGAEKPNKPLSDNKIATILDEQGIKVARRTVAKYREAMAIPPSNERKRLA